MNITDIEKKLLKLSPSIRVVTICNNNGKLIISAHSRRVKITLSKKESQSSLRNAANAWKARRALARKIGSCKYVVAEYDNVKRITMPLGRNHLLYVTTAPSYDHNKVVRKVRSMR